jgi:hypothetical protein
MAMFILVIGKTIREKEREHVNIQKVESTQAIGITIRGMDMVMRNIKLGVQEYSDEGRYEGDWVDDKRHGKGSLLSKSI